MSHVSDGDGHLDHYQRGSIRAPTTSSTATRYSRPYFRYPAAAQVWRLPIATSASVY